MLDADRLCGRPIAGQLFQLPAVSGQHAGIDSIVIGRSSPVDPQAALHGAAFDIAPYDALDLRLEYRVALARAQRHLEITAVDGADLEPDGHVVVLAMRLAETGHAQEQGLILLTVKTAAPER